MTSFRKTALPILDWVFAIGVAGLFATAAIPKILAPAEFASIIWRYDLLPDVAVNLTVLFLPWLELVCAIGLVCIPRIRLEIYWLLGILLAAFTIATALNLLRGISAPCGCFGSASSDPPATWWHVLRNLGFLAGIGCGAWVRALLKSKFPLSK
jgi:hypothetical protein